MKNTRSGQAAGAVLITLAIIMVIGLMFCGCSLTTVDAGQIGAKGELAPHLPDAGR